MTAKKKTKKRKKKTTAKKPKNLRGEIEALRNSISSEHGKAPATTAKQRALRQAWRAILKGRVPRMKRRLNDMLKAKRWVFTADDEGTALIQTHWDQVIRADAAPLYSELAGALFQYSRVRIVWREKTWFGFKKGPNAPVAKIDAIDAQVEAARSVFEEKIKKQRAAYRKTMEEILKAWAARRKTIEGQLNEFQKAMDGLLAAEETRLADLVKSMGSEMKPKDREKVKGLLRNMKTLRRDAKSFSTDEGKKSSLYGGLLRKWNGARRRASKALA